jgi:hypothetical protein
MPRILEVGVTLLSGTVAECVIWVNHSLVVDQAPVGPSAGPSWSGKIPSAKIPLTIEATGIGTSRYRVLINLDGEIITDVDRQLLNGLDIFQKTI